VEEEAVVGADFLCTRLEALTVVVTVIGIPLAAAFFAAAIAAFEVTRTPSRLLLRNFFIILSPSKSAVGTLIESPMSPTANTGLGCSEGSSEDSKEVWRIVVRTVLMSGGIFA
jgi:hypothetical protein